MKMTLNHSSQTEPEQVYTQNLTCAAGFNCSCGGWGLFLYSEDVKLSFKKGLISRKVWSLEHQLCHSLLEEIFEDPACSFPVKSATLLHHHGQIELTVK